MTVASDAIDLLLIEPHRVLVYPDGEEALARETMLGALDHFVHDLQVSDPQLSSLVVLDTLAGRESLAQHQPAIESTLVTDVVDQPGTLHRSQCIFALTPDFLRRTISARFVKSTRFYAIAPESQLSRVEKVHPIHHAIRLEAA